MDTTINGCITHMQHSGNGTAGFSFEGSGRKESHQALAGVNISVSSGAGSIKNLVTDNNGVFEIKDIRGGGPYKFTFSYTGYMTQEIVKSRFDSLKQQSLYVIMKSKIAELDELVIVGYGSQRKRYVAGSISSVKNESYKDQPVTNMQTILQGRVAGVAVNTNSGSPGAAVKVRIRGANSINAGNDPLYVVDGIALSSIGIQELNANDIESIDILKDAAATAIYGSRGANGIVMITTKQGKPGKSVISLQSFTSVNSIAKKYDLLDGPSYAKQANNIAGATIFANPATAPTTDWQDLIFRSVVTQNHQLALSGGIDKVSYFVSGNYVHQPGIVINTNYKKYSLRSDIKVKVSDKTDLSLNLFGARSTGKNNGNLTKGNAVSGVLAWGPAETPYDDNGVYRRYSVSSIWSNPYMLALEQNNENFSNSVLASVGLRHNFTSWLNLTINAGLDYNATKTAYLNNNWITPNNAGSGQSLTEIATLQNSNILTFQKRIARAHNLKVMAIMESTKSTTNSFTARGSGLTSESTGYYNLGLNSAQAISSGYSNWAILSYVGRVDYSFKEKFLLNATYRADGSSKFPRNKWGYFPSVGVGYKLSEEKFIKDIRAIDELKLRASWGKTGNQNIPPYTSLGLLSGLQYSFGTPTLYQGYTLGNPKADLKWETTSQHDIGIDLSLFKRKVGITLDYYQKRTKDLLLQVPVTSYDGGGVLSRNIGIVDNKGFEAALDVTAVKNKNWEWNVSFTAAVNKNKVVNLGKDSIIYRPVIGGGIVNTNIQVVKVGEALSTYYLIPWEGVYQQDDATLGYKAGDNRYTDVSGNKSIGYEDRRVAGIATPTFTYGFNSMLSFKKWEFSFFVFGAAGNKIYNGVYASNAAPTSEIKYPTIIESANYWTPTNTGATWANPASKTNRNFVESTRYLQPGAYARLRNVALSYMLDKNITHFANIRLSVSGQNLLTITKYKGYDPEMSSSGIASDADGGMDFGAYPLPRTITFGASITL